MSHAPEKPPMLSVGASPEQQAQPARCALATGWAHLFSRLQFGDSVRHRGHDARIIEICRAPHYPAITVQWDTAEKRDGKIVMVRSMETITDIKLASVLTPNVKDELGPEAPARNP